MVKIEKIIPGGMGLGTDANGRKVFFWNALPDEVITNYTITKTKSHYQEAIAEAIDNPSSHRISPKDECFLSTSPWQIFDYDYELKQKQALVVEIFREHQITIPTPDIISDRKDFFIVTKWSTHSTGITKKISSNHLFTSEALIVSCLFNNPL